MTEPAKDKDKSAKWLIEHHGDAIHPGKENCDDRSFYFGQVAINPGFYRGTGAKGHPEVPDYSFRSRAARAGSRGEIDPRRDGPGRRRGAGGVLPDLEHFGAELRAIPRPPEPWDPADEPEPKA